MFKRGKDKDELLEALKLLESLTKIDTLAKNGQSVQISGQMVHGQLRWAMSGTFDSYNNAGIAKCHGRTFNALVSTIEGLAICQDMKPTIVVLALADVSLYKDYDGTIETTWLAIDPVCAGMNDAAEIRKDKAVVSFPVVRVKLTEGEYKACESKLALWDEEEHILYPIKQSAFRGLGRLLDCESLLKYSGNAPLASAILLAEGIADANALRFICRKRTEKVLPIVNVVGSKYVRYDQRELIRRSLEVLQGYGVCQVDSWQISDDMTVVNILLGGYNAYYKTVVQIQLSDVISPSIQFCAYAQLGKGRILLQRCSPYTTEKFSKKDGVASHLEKLIGAIDKFAERFDRCANKTVIFDKRMIAPFKPVLGKKRIAAITPPQEGPHCFADLLYAVLNDYYADDLAYRWEQELPKVAAVFFENLRKSIGDEDPQEGTQAVKQKQEVV